MERGDLFWFDADPVRGSEQGGRRPAVVVSRNAVNRVSRVVIVVPITTYRGQRLYPSDIRVSAGDGRLRQDSVVVGLQVRAISVDRLGERLGRLTPDTLSRIDRALLEVLDLPR